MIALTLLLSTVAGAPSCEAAMAERHRAFRPLRAEMRALKAANPNTSPDTYPPPRLWRRYHQFQLRLEAFQRRYPSRDCKTEAAHAGR